MILDDMAPSAGASRPARAGAGVVAVGGERAVALCRGAVGRRLEREMASSGRRPNMCTGSTIPVSRWAEQQSGWIQSFAPDISAPASPSGTSNYCSRASSAGLSAAPGEAAGTGRRRDPGPGSAFTVPCEFLPRRAGRASSQQGEGRCAAAAGPGSTRTLPAGRVRCGATSCSVSTVPSRAGRTHQPGGGLGPAPSLDRGAPLTLRWRCSRTCLVRPR